MADRTPRIVGSSVANILRRRQHSGARQRIEQRRFSCVRIADQSNSGNWRGFATLALLRADAAHIFQLLLDMPYASRNLPTVRFQLRFARASRADAAAQLRHLNAASGEPRQHVMQLRQFHLQLAFAGSRVPRKNIEDQLRAVDDPPLNDLFDIALLRRTEIVIEEQNVGVDRRRCTGNFFQLAGAHQRRRIGPIASLKNFSDDYRAQRFPPRYAIQPETLPRRIPECWAARWISRTVPAAKRCAAAASRAARSLRGDGALRADASPRAHVEPYQERAFALGIVPRSQRFLVAHECACAHAVAGLLARELRKPKTPLSFSA